jgi:hypothetical protein
VAQVVECIQTLLSQRQRETREEILDPKLAISVIASKSCLPVLIGVVGLIYAIRKYQTISKENLL